MRLPGPLITTMLLGARRWLRGPAARIVARRIGVGLPVARLIVTLVVAGLWTVKFLRRTRDRLKHLGSR
jgi:hypothetical protein